MYHSITFGTLNTWDDWHLIPRTRPVVNPPEVKVYQADIPGGDGAIDLTSVLTGRPTYRNRTGSFEFIVENGHKEWHALYSEIMAYLQGQKLHMILEDDPLYYYEGRFSVNAWRSDPHYSIITIDYDVNPYKRYIFSGEAWLWDPFNFLTDVIKSYKNLSIDGTNSVTVEGSGVPTIPVIITSASGFTVQFNGEVYNLVKGNNYIPDIVIQEGENTLIFTGHGTVTIDYHGGIL